MILLKHIIFSLYEYTQLNSSLKNVVNWERRHESVCIQGSLQHGRQDYSPICQTDPPNQLVWLQELLPSFSAYASAFSIVRSVGTLYTRERCSDTMLLIFQGRYALANQLHCTALSVLVARYPQTGSRLSDQKWFYKGSLQGAHRRSATPRKTHARSFGISAKNNQTNQIINLFLIRTAFFMQFSS